LKNQGKLSGGDAAKFPGFNPNLEPMLVGAIASTGPGASPQGNQPKKRDDSEYPLPAESNS